MKVIFVIGATGTGKSDIAMNIAQFLQTQEYDPHIINCDVMQMLPGLPIGTNKPTEKDKTSVPHHFIESCKSPFTETCVQEFVSEASALIEGLSKSSGKEKVPIVCGGTSYYVQGLLFESTEASGTHAPAENACKPEKGTPECDGDSLWDKVRRLDPLRAEKIHPKDTRRLERFLQVGAGSAAAGEPNQVKLRYGSANTLVLWVDWNDSEAHMKALDSRVDKMVQRGLLNEVEDFYFNHFLRHEPKNPEETQRSKRSRETESEDLLERGSTTHGLGSAIGFKEFLPALENAPVSTIKKATESPWKECLEALKTSTRRYAKQQKRWIVNRFLEKYLPSLPVEAQEKPVTFIRLARDVAAQAPLELVPLLGSFALHFLRDQRLAIPVTTSRGGSILTWASDVLVTKERVDRKPQISHCELCDKTTMDSEQWRQHIESKQHKGALRRERNIQQLAEKGIHVVPKKKK